MAMPSVAVRDKTDRGWLMLRRLLRLFSAALLVLATMLVAYGLFGLSKFNVYVGEFYDDRLGLFDNGLYPFLWGSALFVIAEVVRIRHASRLLMAVSTVSLVIVLRLRAGVALKSSGSELFPDRLLLNELRLCCVVLLAISLVDYLSSRTLPGKCSA